MGNKAIRIRKPSGRPEPGRDKVGANDIMCAKMSGQADYESSAIGPLRANCYARVRFNEFKQKWFGLSSMDLDFRSWSPLGSFSTFEEADKAVREILGRTARLKRQ